MRGNLLKYVVHLHEPTFLIGILGVAIGAPEVATGQSHENTGSAGYPLRA